MKVKPNKDTPPTHISPELLQAHGLTLNECIALREIANEMSLLYDQLIAITADIAERPAKCDRQQHRKENVRNSDYCEGSLSRSEYLGQPDLIEEKSPCRQEYCRSTVEHCGHIAEHPIASIAAGFEDVVTSIKTLCGINTPQTIGGQQLRLLMGRLSDDDSIRGQTERPFGPNSNLLL